MGIFDRLIEHAGQGDGETAVDRAELDERRSPQGWRDAAPGWPGSAGAWAWRFAGPWEAVDQLEQAFEAIHHLDGAVCREGPLPPDHRPRYLQALEGYAEALKALYVEDEEMALRKGSYGRLARVLVGHLGEVPCLLAHPLIGLQLGYLPEDLERSGDEDLAREGRKLGEAVGRAREVLARGSTPLPRAGGEATAPEGARRDRPPLTARRVMEVALEACLADGALSSAEEKALRGLRTLLRLPVETYRELADAAGHRAREAGRTVPEEMDPGDLMTRLYRLATANGWISEEEDRLLTAASSYLCVTPAEMEAIKRKVEAEPRGEDAAGESDVGGATLPSTPEEVQALIDAGGPRAAAVYTRLAEIAFEQGQYPHALLLFRSALEIHEQEHGPCSHPVGHALNGMGMACRVLGRYQEAERHYRRAHAIVCELDGERSEGAAALLNNLGVALRHLERFPEAMDAYTRAADLRREVLGEDHPEYASTLNNIASLGYVIGSYELSEEMYGKARAIWEGIHGPAHPRVGGLMGNLANLYQARGRPEEAEEAYRRALEVLGSSLGDDHPALVPPLLGLAAVLHGRGEDEAAEALELRAKTLQARY